jgi:hypothetical protein
MLITVTIDIGKRFKPHQCGSCQYRRPLQSAGQYTFSVCSIFQNSKGRNRILRSHNGQCRRCKPCENCGHREAMI